MTTEKASIMNASSDVSTWQQLCELKAKYFRFIDMKNWEDFADVFTADAILRNSEVTVTGRAEIVEYVMGRLDGAISVHHGHMPEIEINGDEAHGIWAMEDFIERRDGTKFKGYGHYFERYRFEDKWRIAEIQLTRLRRDQF